MKRFACVISLITFTYTLFCQDCLSITTDKTTNLIFPFAIIHVDRGTRDILVQVVKESDHILMIKAARRNFYPTNLSVLTADGNLYCFITRYDSLPGTFIYKVPAQITASVETYANGLIDNPRSIHGIKDKSWDVTSSVKGIYIKDNTIYYQLVFSNSGTINYDIDFLRFYIRDKKKATRTASQENELQPVYISGDIHQIKANTNSVIVVALEKFTIPDGKFLAIEMGEKNGGRNLRMKVSNHKIVRAIALPELR